MSATPFEEFDNCHQESLITNWRPVVVNPFNIGLDTIEGMTSPKTSLSTDDDTTNADHGKDLSIMPADSAERLIIDDEATAQLMNQHDADLHMVSSTLNETALMSNLTGADDGDLSIIDNNDPFGVNHISDGNNNCEFVLMPNGNGIVLLDEGQMSRQQQQAFSFDSSTNGMVPMPNTMPNQYCMELNRTAVDVNLADQTNQQNEAHKTNQDAASCNEDPRQEKLFQFQASKSLFWTAMHQRFCRSEVWLEPKMIAEVECMGIGTTTCAASVLELFSYSRSMAIPCCLVPTSTPTTMRSLVQLLDRAGTELMFANMRDTDIQLASQLLAIHDVYELLMWHGELLVAIGWWFRNHQDASPQVLDAVASFYHPLLFSARKARARFLWKLVKIDISPVVTELYTTVVLDTGIRHRITIVDDTPLHQHAYQAWASDSLRSDSSTASEDGIGDDFDINSSFPSNISL